MIYLQYKNQWGTISISNRVTDRWRATAITGLGYPGREFSTVTYYGVDGQRTTSTRLTPRTITISGDIQNFGGMQHEISRAIEILHFPGTLTVSAGGRRRSAQCRCSSFENTERNRVVEQFVMQLIADDPNFYDVELTCQDIFGEQDLVQDSFTLPCVFTRRINQAAVVNRGYTNLEPVIRIYCQEEEAGAAARSGEMGISVENLTTGATIALTKQMENGETITIDVKNRAVLSSVVGDITGLLSPDSFLDQFYLVPGPNEIQTLSSSSGVSVWATCEYYNTYLEAVY